MCGASGRADILAIYGAYHRAMYGPYMELPTEQMFRLCMKLYMELDFDGDFDDMEPDYAVDN